METHNAPEFILQNHKIDYGNVLGKAIAGFFIPFFSISPHSFHLQKVDDVANCSSQDIPWRSYLIVPIFHNAIIWKIATKIYLGI